MGGRDPIGPGGGDVLKYLVFLAFTACAVPAVAMLSRELRWRERFVALLVFSTAIGDVAGINFFSLESYRGPDRGFEFTLTDIVAVGLLIGLFLKGERKLPWMWGTLALFFGWSTLSALAGPDLLLSAFSLFKLVRIFLLYWAVYLALKSGVSPRWLVYGMIGTGLFVAQLAVRQKYMMGIYRIPGPFDHSNTVPLFLNLMLPTVAAWALGLGRTTLERRLAGVAVAGMLFAVLATFSRAGAALSVLALLGVVVVAQRQIPSRAARFMGLGLVAILTVGGGMAADSFLDRIRNAPESSAEARSEFNVAARYMAHDYPLGVGLNRFPEVLTVRQEYRAHIRVMGTEEHAGVAHHIYWLTAAELGWPGLLLFLVIMARFTLRGLRCSDRGEMRMLGFALFTGLMTLHASGLLEWAFRITPVTALFGVVAAMAASIPERVVSEHPAPQTVTRNRTLNRSSRRARPTSHFLTAT